MSDGSRGTHSISSHPSRRRSVCPHVVTSSGEFKHGRGNGRATKSGGRFSQSRGALRSREFDGTFLPFGETISHRRMVHRESERVRFVRVRVGESEERRW